MDGDRSTQRHIPQMLATFLITRCEGTAYRFANLAQDLP
jgi:hypothetical protein